MGQGEQFTPASGSRFTAITPTASTTTPRQVSSSGSVAALQPSDGIRDLQLAARAGGLANLVTGGTIPGLSTATSIANLLARFNDPRVSNARLALGTASDVSGLVNTAARFEPLKSVLSPIVAPGALPSLAPSAAAGASALSLGASEGATAATEAFINAYQAAIDAGATSSQALNAALSTGTLPTGSILSGIGAVLGLGSGALALSEGNIGGGVAGIGGGAAGLAAATGLIPAGAAGLIAGPLALTALAGGPGEGLAANLGLGSLFGKKDILHNKQKEAALQKHLAAGAISHMQNVVAGGFQIPDILAYMNSSDNLSNQGFAGAATAPFREAVWAKMVKTLLDADAAKYGPFLLSKFGPDIVKGYEAQIGHYRNPNDSGAGRAWTGSDWVPVRMADDRAGTLGISGPQGTTWLTATPPSPDTLVAQDVLVSDGAGTYGMRTAEGIRWFSPAELTAFLTSLGSRPGDTTYSPATPRPTGSPFESVGGY